MEDQSLAVLARGGSFVEVFNSGTSMGRAIKNKALSVFKLGPNYKVRPSAGASHRMHPVQLTGISFICC